MFRRVISGGSLTNELNQGETDNQVLAFAAERSGKVEACAAKPGYITGGGSMMRSVWATALRWTAALPNIPVEEMSATMLDQVVRGFEVEPLTQADLRRIGERALQIGSSSSLMESS
jgi:hypothetical protein